MNDTNRHISKCVNESGVWRRVGILDRNDRQTQDS